MAKNAKKLDCVGGEIVRFGANGWKTGSDPLDKCSPERPIQGVDSRLCADSRLPRFLDDSSERRLYRACIRTIQPLQDG